jgi:hypothetical protein
MMLGRPNVVGLATTATDDLDPASLWPTPLPKVPTAGPRVLDSPREPLPIDPGSWGRPPPAVVERADPPTWALVGAPPLPPHSTSNPPDGQTGLANRMRRRRNSAAVEAVVALLVLTGLALFGSSGRTLSASNNADAASRWTATALPVLTNLIDDAGAIQKDTDPSVAFSGLLPHAVARYKMDLTAADRLPAPSNAGLAQAWQAARPQLTTALGTVAAADPANPETAARAHLRFAAVQTVLLELVQAIRPAR